VLGFVRSRGEGEEGENAMREDRRTREHEEEERKWIRTCCYRVNW
jgi:hypothetical protein